jgi:hypothetical protein
MNASMSRWSIALRGVFAKRGVMWVRRSEWYPASVLGLRWLRVLIQRWAHSPNAVRVACTFSCDSRFRGSSCAWYRFLTTLARDCRVTTLLAR